MTDIKVRYSKSNNENALTVGDMAVKAKEETNSVFLHNLNKVSKCLGN